MRLTDQHQEQLKRIRRGQLSRVEFGTRVGDLVRDLWLEGLVVGQYWATPPLRGSKRHQPDPDEPAAGLIGLRRPRMADLFTEPDYQGSPIGARTSGSR
jgi:hypothetical protein